MCMHALISCHASTDDAKAADVVRKAMQEANITVTVIEAFKPSDLLELYNVGGYTTALLIQNAQRAGLEKCLKPAFVDLLVNELDRLRREWDTCSDCNSPEITVSTHVPHGFGHAYAFCCDVFPF